MVSSGLVLHYLILNFSKQLLFVHGNFLDQGGVFDSILDNLDNVENLADVTLNDMNFTELCLAACDEASNAFDLSNFDPINVPDDAFRERTDLEVSVFIFAFTTY